MAESRVSAWAFRDGLRHRLHQRKIWIRAFAASRDENNRTRLVSEIGEIKNKKNFHFVGEKSHSPIRLSIAQEEECIIARIYICEPRI